jgi:acyl carrier protein
MTKQEFVEKLREELEFEIILTPDTVLKDVETWDSMGAMILIGFVSDNFGINLTGEEVKRITTIQSLIDKIGDDKFS